jgi:biopolymer transport protein ExbD
MKLPSPIQLRHSRIEIIPLRDVPVYISGDRDTLHGRMAAVLRTVRAAGLQKVAFMVDGDGGGAEP